MNQKRFLTRFFHSTGKLTFPVLPGSWVLYLALFFSCADLIHLQIFTTSHHHVACGESAASKQERSQIKAGPLGMEGK